MISQHELPGYIEKNLPELSVDSTGRQNVYDIVKQMVAYTTSQIARHNLNAAKQCFALAGKLHKQGNSLIKNAIENVYVFSFSHAFLYDDALRSEITEILPLSLYELYRKQVINSHL